jgi:hypothetical protein
VKALIFTQSRHSEPTCCRQAQNSLSIVDILRAINGEDSYGVSLVLRDSFGGFLPQPPTSAEDNEKALLLGYPPIGLVDEGSYEDATLKASLISSASTPRLYGPRRVNLRQAFR